ncbi:MAG: nitrate reductase cytochrome c-type subunit [Rubrivivax sp.]|nr:nitrate reductase cytochrome c-type subunit [Rubrivivax sp.]
MKRPAIVYAVVLTALAGCAAVAIEDRQVGLSKTSVFDVVTPTPFGFEGPEAAKTIPPLPGSGMPPMISHTVDEYLPLTVKNNECLECHDKPGRIGTPVAAGKPRPAPASHYAAGAGGSMVLLGRQYNCLFCHAPQAGVQPLVRNTSN